eukprot:m.316717 g.316717  ORF g.316717 m.316717 type:complete len:94 (+) comp27547_c5_seq5:4338-4619(+)
MCTATTAKNLITCIAAHWVWLACACPVSLGKSSVYSTLDPELVLVCLCWLYEATQAQGGVVSQIGCSFFLWSCASQWTRRSWGQAVGEGVTNM